MQNYDYSQLKKSKKIKLMTHVVAGYPSLSKSKEIVLEMSRSGVDIIEIQIPFSDPIADGPTIVMANQHALDKQVSVKDCFKLMNDLSTKIDTPLLFMSYSNIPFAMGVHSFLKRALESGAKGAIIPDMPFDQEDDKLWESSFEKNMPLIPVISPDIRKERLKNIIDKIKNTLIYTTLKIGITGTAFRIEKNTQALLNNIKKNFTGPIAAGFGLNNPKQILSLPKEVDIAVVGSHFINLINQNKDNKKGLRQIIKFIEEVKK